MTPTEQINLGVVNSEIQQGAVVRLLKPFKPEWSSWREYCFGLVAGIVPDSSRSRNQQANFDSQPTGQGYQPGEELIVYLYDPESSTVYVDRFGAKALFSFDSDEVEPVTSGR